jgi:hypothetical protein
MENIAKERAKIAAGNAAWKAKHFKEGDTFPDEGEVRALLNKIRREATAAKQYRGAQAVLEKYLEKRGDWRKGASIQSYREYSPYHMFDIERNENDRIQRVRYHPYFGDDMFAEHFAAGQRRLNDAWDYQLTPNYSPPPRNPRNMPSVRQPRARSSVYMANEPPPRMLQASPPQMAASLTPAPMGSSGPDMLLPPPPQGPPSRAQLPMPPGGHRHMFPRPAQPPGEPTGGRRRRTRHKRHTRKSVRKHKKSLKRR